MALHPPRTKFGQRLYLGVLALIVIVFSAIFLAAIPQKYSPIAPLDLEQKGGPFAGVKLANLRKNPAQCLATLARSKLAMVPLPDKAITKSCAYKNAVSVKQSFYPYSKDLEASCPLAAALYLWERQVVAPAAARHLSSAVVRIEMFGAYSCRRRNGAAEGAMSEHATANAIDIAGFTLANGDEITIEKTWKKKTAEAAFLHEVRDGGCGLFQGVLSPDYNKAHYNHLHFDMGEYKLCR